MDANILAETYDTETVIAAAFQALPERVIVIARDGRVVSINQVAKEICPFPEGANPRWVEEIFLGPRPEILQTLFSAATDRKVSLRSLSNEFAEPLRFTLTILSGAQNRLGYFLLTSGQDQTVLNSFSKLNGQVEAADRKASNLRRLELQETLKRLEQFSYVAAHDLKAPLNNISMLLDFIDEDYGAELPEDAREMVHQANTAATRLQNLIQDLLKHARSGTAKLDFATVPITPIVMAIQTSLSQISKNTGAIFKLQGDLGQVQADAGLLHQLLENIIGNGLKYRHPDRPPQIKIRALRNDTMTTGLVISDNGLGFDPAKKAALFEPFKRLHSLPDVEGTGIGLSTCKTICQRHGWLLDATGKPGEGAAFTVLFSGGKPDTSLCDNPN